MELSGLVGPYYLVLVIVLLLLTQCSSFQPTCYLNHNNNKHIVVRGCPSSLMLQLAKYADSSSKGGRSQSYRTGSTVKKHSPRNDVKKLRFTRILRDELSDIICTGDINAGSMPDDGLLRGVMIPRIELNSDFSCAKVYLSIFGNAVEKRKVFVWLSQHRSKVQHSLRTRLKEMRSIPQISLFLEDTQTTAYMDKVFDEINAEVVVDSDNNGDYDDLDDADYFEEVEPEQ